MIPNSQNLLRKHYDNKDENKVNKEITSRILRTLPREKAFYFFTSIGNYTGESASSIKEFIDKINQVNTKSLEFHFYRRDFERWTAEVLEDETLAKNIEVLRRLSLAGDRLKSELHQILTKRYSILKSRL